MKCSLSMMGMVISPKPSSSQRSDVRGLGRLVFCSRTAEDRVVATGVPHCEWSLSCGFLELTAAAVQDGLPVL
jgi:hypothetical protein